MQMSWLDSRICYDGTQLKSHWISETAGIDGDAIASFIGPADVPIENMVDLEDVANDEPIFSRSMLHFIVEHMGLDLPLAVARQRLITAIAAELLHGYRTAANVVRKGDDLYDGERKISVSIATTSPTSSLIHFAMNIESAGTPLPTKGLDDFGIEPKPFAMALMNTYAGEIESMAHACTKVRPVP